MKSRLSLLAKNVQTLFRPLAIGCISAALMMSLPVAAVDRAGDDQVVGDYPVINLFNQSTDVLGRSLDYPECSPAIHAVIITMAPGQVGKEHQHLTPLFAYILEGELEVTYQAEPVVVNIYRKGDAFMEAMHVMHHGSNPSLEQPAKLLALYLNCED